MYEIEIGQRKSTITFWRFIGINVVENFKWVNDYNFSQEL